MALAAASLLLRSQLRFASRHPVAVGAALAGICLAVAAVSVVHLVAKGVRADLAARSAGSAFGHTHVLTAYDLDQDAYFALRRQWRTGEPALAAVAGMVPVIEGNVATGGRVLPLVGFDPLADALRGSTPLPALGSRLADFLATDTVLAPPEAAAALRAGGAVAGVPVQVIEVAEAQMLIADLPTAQRLLGRPGALDAVWLRVADQRRSLVAWLDGLLPGIEAALPDQAGPVVPGYAVSAASRWQPLRRFGNATMFLLGALALLSVFMAGALAAQASLTNAARRQRERDRLLALGVSAAAQRWLAAAEGMVVGTLASGLGLAIGVALAVWLLRLGAVDTAAARIDPWLVAKALACGVLVAGAAAGFAGGKGMARPRIAWMLAGAVAVAAAGLWHGTLAGAFAALFAVALVHLAGAVPLLARLVQAAAGHALRRRPSVRLANLGARATLRAVAARAGEIRLALGALSVAAAVAVAMGLMVASLRMDFLTMLDQRLWPGVSVRLPVEAPGFDVADLRWLQALPGVLEVRRYGDLAARLPAGPLRLAFAELDAAETARYGFDGSLARGAMLNEVGARRHGLEIGQTAVVHAAGARVEVPIAHVFPDYGAVETRLILPMAWRNRFPAADPAAGGIGWRRLTVRGAEPRLDAVRERLAARFGADAVADHAQARALALAVFDRTFAVSRLLTVVALALAAIGLYAALAAMLSGREREFALLRATGWSRAEVWRLALAQATLLGGIAALAALPLGAFMAWVLCAVVNPLAFGWSIALRFDWPAVGLPLALCVAAAVAAGALPSYRLSYRVA